MWSAIFFIPFFVGSSLSQDVISTELYNAILDGIDCGCVRETNLLVPNVKVRVINYETNSSATYDINESGLAILNRTDFNAMQGFAVFVPGFNNQDTGNPSTNSRCAFSKMKINGMGVFGIVIDHSYYTTGNVLESLNLAGVYKKSVYYEKSIAYAIANQVLMPLAQVIDLKQLQIIGHSLGGQMVGHIGEAMKANGKGLYSIFAADPAGPCYNDCPAEHVKDEDANITVAFHCNAGEFGSTLNLTHYDFYSNNGVTQIGCEGTGLIGIIKSAYSSMCSHTKCVAIMENPAFREQIWPAVQCTDAKKYSNGQCGWDNTTLAGYTIIPSGPEGIYFLTPEKVLQCEANFIA